MDTARIRSMPSGDEGGSGWVVASQRAAGAGSLWTALRSLVAGPDEAHEPERNGSEATSVQVATDGPEIERAIADAARAGATRLVVLPRAYLGEVGSSDVGPDIEPALDRMRARYPALEIGSIGVRGDDAAMARLIELLRTDQPYPLETVDEALARVFGDRADVLTDFLDALYSGLPAGTGLCLRGSAVNGASYETGAPFDAGGPGSSDLDVVAIGAEAAACWVEAARLLGGVNSLPLCDGSEWVAPRLDPARRRAQAIVDRPVSLQSMARWFLDLRAAVQGQRYIELGPPAT